VRSESPALAGEHDPGVVLARERAEGIASAHAFVRVGGTPVRFGTASWTDPTILAPGVFYPDGVSSAEARLRFYSKLFPLVEVDSGYYALPVPKTSELWVDRTPDDFVFNIKAFAWMTGHATETARLPRSMREALPEELAAKRRLYAKEVPSEIRDEAWRLFVDALRPLNDAGKLGAVLLQYPRWVRPAPHSPQMLARARERLGGMRAAVEFRHADWLAPRLRDRTFSLLRELDFAYVIVDEPQGLPSSVPAEVAVTTPSLAVLRMHGRRADTWEKRGATVQEKFRYLYSGEELSTWVPKIVEISGEAEQVHVVFNNCYGNYGTTNALELAALVGRKEGGGGRG
jgi:uncharacterized protein YecE (DUF72 family)